MNFHPIDSLVQLLFLPLLTFFYSIFPNYGVAILLVTLLIKIIFFPLNQKQFKSIKISQKLQPEVKKIQEKYKDDPKTMQQEMMKLWKENNANPFAGCLPTLIQLPFFFAIFATMKSPAFETLLNTTGANKGLLPFFLPNLALHDNTFILPIAIGVLTFWSQKLFITDKKQAAMFMFMPFLMVFISWKMPAGVVLYWAFSQLLTTLQQLYIMKKHDDSTEPQTITVK